METELQQWESEQQQQEQQQPGAPGAGFSLQMSGLAVGSEGSETTFSAPSVSLAELLEAYFSCRRNKRGTVNALAFELDYESELLALRDEINDGVYCPRRSVAFIVDKPVKREIFAADFRDRVVHHLIINKLNPEFERAFIFDSYACRVGKGTLFGIQRLDRFIRECSAGYTRDCYVLKLDIRGFFMHINATLLNSRLADFIGDRFTGNDASLLAYLCRVVVLNKASDNCVVRGRATDWVGLPHDKSLFHSPPECGLPIGNLSSQVFANFYLNRFDHFVKHDLGVRHYGRYVDDFVLVHQSREHLLSLVVQIREFLLNDLGLELHPRKIYLQHYSHGVQYLGVVLKPGRIYAASRTKGNFYLAIQRHNQVVSCMQPSRLQQEAFRSSMNSYLGWLAQFRTRRLRRAMVSRHVRGWWKYAHVGGDVSKIVLRPIYDRASF